MNIVYGVPWRDLDPWRARCWAHVREHLLASGHWVREADSGAEPFSRAASRNLAVELAADADVVILHDADMIVPHRAYAEMAIRAHQTGRMVIGFSQYRALGPAITEAVLNGADPWTAEPIGVLDAWSVGGIIAITPTAWREVGGMDEGFTSWGCEDFAFASAAKIVLGPLERHPCAAVHLWHEHGSDPENAAQQANTALLERYSNAANLAELRAIQGG